MLSALCPARCGGPAAAHVEGALSRRRAGQQGSGLGMTFSGDLDCPHFKSCPGRVCCEEQWRSCNSDISHLQAWSAPGHPAEGASSGLVSGRRAPDFARLPDPCAQVGGLVTASDPAVNNPNSGFEGHCILLQEAGERSGILNGYCCILQ